MCIKYFVHNSRFSSLRYKHIENICTKNSLKDILYNSSHFYLCPILSQSLHWQTVYTGLFHYKWYVTQLNTTKGTSCLHLRKFRFLHYLTEDLTSFPIIPNSLKLKWFFWKYKFYKLWISFSFLYILHTVLFIISE